jgi:chromosome segregation ATPase
MRIDTERNFKWIVERNSVEKKIKQLQQAIQFASRSQLGTTSYNQSIDQSQLDITSHDNLVRETDQPSEEMEWLRERVEQLEDENVQLKIDKQAREQIINQMNSERKDFIGQLKDMSFQLGEATAKLQQIEAPRAQPEARPVDAQPAEQTRDAIDVQSEPAPTPSAAPAPAEQPKRSFFDRLRGR